MPGGGSQIVARARALAVILRSVSLDAAPCLSGGALAALFHERLDLQFMAAFTLGFFCLVGPVDLSYATGWGMRRTLGQIKEWEQAGLIDAPQARRLRDRAINWYIARRF